MEDEKEVHHLCTGCIGDKVFAQWVLTNCRSSSPPIENFGFYEISLDPSPKSPIKPSLSCPTEGRFTIVTNAGRDAVDAAASVVKNDGRAGSLGGP
jgi:hypothetical protein